MKYIEYTGDWYENMQQLVRGFLFHDFDSYQEWQEFTYPTKINGKKITDEKRIPIGESDYYLLKQELEKIFKERESMEDKNVYEYAEGVIDPNRRHIYIFVNCLSRFLL